MDKARYIAQNGIIETLVDFFDCNTMLSNNAEYIKELLFKNDEYDLSESGIEVVDHLEHSIKSSCSESDIEKAYNKVKDIESELNSDFYDLTPKIFANSLINIREKKQNGLPVSETQKTAFDVVDFLGKSHFGEKEFLKLAKQEVSIQSCLVGPTK